MDTRFQVLRQGVRAKVNHAKIITSKEDLMWVVVLWVVSLL